MAGPHSLTRGISPPLSRKKSSTHLRVQGSSWKNRVEGSAEEVSSHVNGIADAGPTIAAIEAGEVRIRDHLEYFSKHLSNLSKSVPGPRISIHDFRALYERNQHTHGRHFVIHQHDHPISGVHYDLRLQFSDTSTISFAVPYGLPGNPNSVRPTRMAIETRVHNLWNNLIESASHATGSLLIWDTGEFEVLPRTRWEGRTTDEELSDSADDQNEDKRSHSERLFAAFKGRHIRLRLHGARLPCPYVVSLRLSSANNRDRQPRKPRIQRKRLNPEQATIKPKHAATESETSDETDNSVKSSLVYNDNGNDDDIVATAVDAAVPSEDEEDDAGIRLNNAYPRSTNTIGSIHQRHWFLALDRRSSGFRKIPAGHNEVRWMGDWEPFFVRGRDYERSVVTGRTADDVMADEGVHRFVGRRLWRPVME